MQTNSALIKLVKQNNGKQLQEKEKSTRDKSSKPKRDKNVFKTWSL